MKRKLPIEAKNNSDKNGDKKNNKNNGSRNNKNNAGRKSSKQQGLNLRGLEKFMQLSCTDSKESIQKAVNRLIGRLKFKMIGMRFVKEKVYG